MKRLDTFTPLISYLFVNWASPDQCEIDHSLAFHYLAVTASFALRR